MRGICASACAVHLGEVPGEPREDPARDEGRDAAGCSLASCQTNRSDFFLVKTEKEHLVGTLFKTFCITL